MATSLDPSEVTMTTSLEPSEVTMTTSSDPSEVNTGENNFLVLSILQILSIYF